MKALTLYQPWATFIALGLKRYETRSWPTTYRGPLLIHAGKVNESLTWGPNFGSGVDAEEESLLEEARLLATGVSGAVVATAELVACDRVETLEPSAMERAVGNFEPGRYAWKLINTRALGKPIFCKGAQGLWTPRPETVDAAMGLRVSL